MKKIHFSTTLIKFGQPMVNFIMILLAAFALIFFCQEITKPNCKREKVAQSTFVQKKASVNC